LGDDEDVGGEEEGDAERERRFRNARSQAS
jgi:hypothetical protein